MDQKKKVFISHSSKDKALADAVCRVFEETGLGCWIAPRDIPYGEEWATEITDAIFEAEIMVLVLTANSNASHQVIREINLALQTGLKLIPLYIDGEMPKGGLNYYLSTVQGIAVRRENLKDQIQRIAEALKTDGVIPILGNKEAPEEDLDDVILEDNLDEALEERFRELFDRPQEREKEGQALSPFKQKLMDRICKNLIENAYRAEEEQEPETPATERDREGPQGDKYFSMTETTDKIAVFLVRIRIDPRTYRKSFVPEVLERTRSVQEDGSTRATFQVLDLDPEGNPLIVLHFLPEKAMAMINMGFLDGNEVRMSKKMEPMNFKIVENQSERIQRYRVNEHGSMVTVDPLTADVVERKQYFSRRKNQTVSYMELYPGKRYLVFQLRSEAPEETAPAGMIARAYYWGRDGLPKNLLAAAEWFEADGSPESWYYLGRIFTEDPLLGDPADAAYYLRKAAEAGEEKARAYMGAMGSPERRIRMKQPDA